MPRRLKLIVAYDGTAFAGWQSQSHRQTVQDTLERVFSKVTGESLGVHGAGRTDAGVHALGQCAHVDVRRPNLSCAEWRSALNALLPASIRIMRCRFVSPKFHARFSAKGKIYRYRIWLDAVLPPLEVDRAWHIPAPLDFDLLRSATEQFIGTHNFAAVAANRGQPGESTVRTLFSSHVRRQGRCAVFEFDGDGFLYRMVRLMVGSAVRCAFGKMPLEQIKTQLDSGRRSGSRLAAPAEGLFLVRVRY